MNQFRDGMKKTLFVAAAFAMLMSPAVHARQPSNDVPENIARMTVSSDDDAAALFPDASFGVDPVVTGPVSKSFREQQKLNNCDMAAWPKIPAACYPG
jgi:hypothetical protein